MNEVLSFVNRGGLRDLVISRPRRAYSLYPLHGSFSPFSDLLSRHTFQQSASQQSSRVFSFSETTKDKLGGSSREKESIIKKDSKRAREVRESLDLSRPPSSLHDGDGEVSSGGRRARRRERRTRQGSGDGLHSSIFDAEKEEEEDDEPSDFSWGIRVPPQEFINNKSDLSSSFSPPFSSSSSSSPPPSLSPLLSHERARESQVVYVWLDALAAYLTAAGYPQTHSEQFKRRW